MNCFYDAATNITLGADRWVTGDITLPNVSIAGGYTLVIEGNSSPGQAININSLTGSGDVEIEANTDAGDANESVVLKVAGKAADGVTELAVPFDLSQMAWKQNSASQQLRRVGAPDRLRRLSRDQHEGRQQPVGRDDLRAQRGLHAAGHSGSVRVGTGQNGHQRRQRRHSLRPAPRDRLLGRRPPDGRQLHLERSPTSRTGSVGLGLP